MEMLTHPLKFVWIETIGTLLICDLHLGKINHFRKSGVAVPLQADLENFQRLNRLILSIQPENVFFLGDLFHSEYNRGWEEFEKLCRGFPAVDMHLVKGNHDILDDEIYKNTSLLLHPDIYYIGAIILSHIPIQERHRHNHGKRIQLAQG